MCADPWTTCRRRTSRSACGSAVAGSGRVLRLGLRCQCCFCSASCWSSTRGWTPPAGLSFPARAEGKWVTQPENTRAPRKNYTPGADVLGSKPWEDGERKNKKSACVSRTWRCEWICIANERIIKKKRRGWCTKRGHDTPLSGGRTGDIKVQEASGDSFTFWRSRILQLMLRRGRCIYCRPINKIRFRGNTCWLFYDKQLWVKSCKAHSKQVVAKTKKEV